MHVAQEMRKRLEKRQEDTMRRVFCRLSKHWMTRLELNIEKKFTSSLQ